ncbi:MAG: glycosyltransferase family 4 protein [Terriglobales bacterium]
MRILMTADASGGVGVLADELARALLARGHQVLITVFSPTQPEFSPGLHRLWAPFRLEWMDCNSEAAVAADARAGRAFLADLARHWRPDVLHSNQFAYVGVVPGIPTLLGVHSDVISWWRSVRGSAPPGNAYQRWYAVNARQALEGAAAVVAPSQAARDDLRRSYGWRHPVRVIVNGRDASLFRCEHKQPFALAVGRWWDEGKGLTLLQGLREHGGLEVAVAGELRHPLRPSPCAPLAGLRVLGQLPPAALRDWMARALIYVGTSRYEPFGLAVLEAALSGCALALHDIPSWRELWGPVAWFFRTRAELRALLRRAAAEPAWAWERGEAACRYARRRFTAARMAQAYEAVYRQIEAPEPKPALRR